MRFPHSFLLTVLAVASFGCSGSVPYPVAPLPVAPTTTSSLSTKPEAIFTATPNSIAPGETATLQWSTRRAEEAVIEPGGGSVPLSGTLTVTPTEDTTYTLWMRGPGGETTMTARVGVRRANPLGALTEQPRRRNGMFSGTFDEEVANRLRDIHFDYDSNAIRPDQQPTLAENARTLRALFDAFPTGRLLVEGHCDERGSSEYNLALGDRRAQAVVEYLDSQGVPLGRVMLVGYGEEKPQCRQQNEACYQLNRRAHFAPSR